MGLTKQQTTKIRCQETKISEPTGNQKFARSNEGRNSTANKAIPYGIGKQASRDDAGKDTLRRTRLDIRA